MSYICQNDSLGTSFVMNTAKWINIIDKNDAKHVKKPITKALFSSMGTYNRGLTIQLAGIKLND